MKFLLARTVIATVTTLTLATMSFAADFTLTVAATNAPEGSPLLRSMTDLKQTVESRTEGRLTIDLAINGEFGGERETAELTELGEIQGTWVSDLGLAALNEQIGFATLPFLFPTYEDVDRNYIGGFVGEAVKEKLIEQGLLVLAVGESDYRELTTRNTPVIETADLRGLKIRTPEFQTLLSFFNKLGASPTPMAFPEIYTALQQGTIDGQDNGSINTTQMRFYEQQKHFTWTNHVYTAAFFIVNDEWFQTLPEDIRSILTEEVVRTSALQVQYTREQVVKNIETMQAAGVQIHELSDAAKADFRAAAREIWEEARNDYDPAIMDRIFAELGQ